MIESDRRRAPLAGSTTTSIPPPGPGHSSGATRSAGRAGQRAGDRMQREGAGSGARARERHLASIASIPDGASAVRRSARAPAQGGRRVAERGGLATSIAGVAPRSPAPVISMCALATAGGVQRTDSNGANVRTSPSSSRSRRRHPGAGRAAMNASYAAARPTAGLRTTTLPISSPDGEVVGDAFGFTWAKERDLRRARPPLPRRRCRRGRGGRGFLAP